MRIKKFMSVLLIVALMFSFCSFFVSAAHATELNVLDMDYRLLGIVDGTQTDWTSSVTVSSETFLDVDCVKFNIPAKNSSYDAQTLVNYHISDLVTTHEYNVNFKFYTSVITNNPFIQVNLNFYSTSGNLIKTQILYTSGKVSHSWNTVNFNFVPDMEGVTGGYTTELQFVFFSQAILPIVYRLSNPIILTDKDKDDNTGWFERIINAIKEIPSNFVNGIKSFFDNLGNKISELGDNIQSFFVDLGENIGEFFTMLKNYLLYFQHPVTTNSDGVLVDGSGNPVYTNPFDSAMNSVKNTVDVWLSDIDDFIADIDESRLNVKTYLETGSGVINDVLGASPILSAALIFAAAFLVIRKVVGR